MGTRRPGTSWFAIAAVVVGLGVTACGGGSPDPGAQPTVPPTSHATSTEPLPTSDTL